MLLTADLCAAKGWELCISCRACRTVKVMGARFIVDRGYGAQPLALLFDKGQLRCSVHHIPAELCIVSTYNVGKLVEIARWSKEWPRPSPSEAKS